MKIIQQTENAENIIIYLVSEQVFLKYSVKEIHNPTNVRL